MPLNNVVIATIATDGGPPINPSLYTATIDWGDATAFTPGFVDPTTGELRGSHVYQESGTYTVRTTVGTFDDPGLAVFTRTIDVADVPIVLTGQLDPASDSGISDSDGITFVRQPTYFGTSEDLSRVTLSAQNVLGGPAVSLGGTIADQGGFWQITSGVALVDGQYTITATAVDRNGMTTATTPLGTITIDTVGPRVTNLSFVQSPGRLVVQFQDDRSGLAQASLTDGRNYRVQKPHLRPGRLLVRNLSVTLPTGPTAPQTVTAPLTNNRPHGPPRWHVHGDRVQLEPGDYRRRRQSARWGVLRSVPVGQRRAGWRLRGDRKRAAQPHSLRRAEPARHANPQQPEGHPGRRPAPTRAQIASAAQKKRLEAHKANWL